MLVLSRKTSQQITIGTDIVLTVVRIDRNQVRIGIQAPQGVPVLRDELTCSRSREESAPPLASTGCEAGQR